MLATAIAGLQPGAAGGQISPGELSRAHAAIDGSDGCLDCHRAKSGVDANLCADCHSALGERTSRGLGLHARPEYRHCERCHIEHQGREFPLVYWGKEGEAGFDHAIAGFALEGAHETPGCRACHAPERRATGAPRDRNGVDPRRSFLGLSADCATCHDDVHRGQFAGSSCSDCHGSSRFAGAERFRHGDSGFPLTGLHAGVSCTGCHDDVLSPAGGSAAAGAAAKRYRGLPRSCSGCHSDPHQRRLGAECASCHVTEGWRVVESSGFDHGRTRYPLTGRHARVACAGCHRTGARVPLVGYEICSSCHPDEHAGQFAARSGGCADCHSTAGFSPSSFDVRRHEQTRYPLEGAHRAVTCADCHRAAAPRSESSPRGGGNRGGAPLSFRFPSLECAACHADPHPAPRSAAIAAGASTGAAATKRFACVDCHGVEIWREVRFEHARTTYPLEGGHARASCAACHSEVGARRIASVDRTDRAAGPIGFGPVARGCTTCHEDPHLGQLAGRRAGSRAGAATCADCHRLEGWSELDFVHDRDTDFALEGGHRAVPCAGCHPAESAGGRRAVRYRPLDRRCAACHGAAISSSPPHE